MDWNAEKWFVTDASAFQKQLLDEITEKAISTFITQSQGKITGVESVTHSDVKYWTEWLGQLHKWSGTTKVVFLSTQHASPELETIIALICVYVLPHLGTIITAALALGVMYFLYRTVTYVGEKAPEALAALAGAAGLGIVLILVLMFMPKREVKS